MRTALVLLLAALLPAVPASAAAQPVARFETPPAFDDEAGGDADADDPALWIDRRDPARSVVLGTLKNGGLDAYRLDGSPIEHVATPAGGRFNNVDIAGDLAIVTDRGLDRLRVYRVDRDGVTDVTSPDAPLVFSADEAEVEEQATAYGLAAVRAHGRIYVAVSRRHRTTVALLRLVPSRAGWTYERVDAVDLPATFALPGGGTWTPCAEPGEEPQVEGMVIDGDRATLFAAQEDVGIWRIPLGRHGYGSGRLIDRVREFGVPAAFDEETEECAPSGPDPGFGGRHLSADAEGLTIYDGHGRSGYLLASSQGDSTFSAYADRGDGRWLGSFAIAAAGTIDGVQHSDGATVTPRALGRAFPHGVFITHDGEETPNFDRTATNFKLVPWESVAAAFSPPLR
jgi:3-phytase